ncbi:MAG TPA: type II secretion system protein [Gaiellaceae bacterium]|jgi:type II secretory pathway pseudopilin PulG|nr:type II secretion system protein [Gaiellaceae bacterium]
MEAPSPRSEAGFGLIELLISMVVLQIALLAIIGAFSAGALALGRAGLVNTAAALADTQMELYRSMPYDAIGLDTAGAPTTGMYVADTVACPSGQTPVCANTDPRNNTVPNTGNWSCTAATGTTSVLTYFSANGINPCVAHRTVSGTASPDGKTYYVDTYIAWAAAAGQRATKTVSVLVRDSAGAKVLAKVITTFDCSTGQSPTAGAC